jgi:hypothetical protein
MEESNEIAIILDVIPLQDACTTAIILISSILGRLTPSDSPVLLTIHTYESEF